MTQYRIVSPIHNVQFGCDRATADEKFDVAVQEARNSTAPPVNSTIELHEVIEPNIAGETKLLRAEPTNPRQTWLRVTNA